MTWRQDEIADQTGRVALVTGGNSGIGFHVVRLLAARGAHVLLAARDRRRAQEALDRLDPPRLSGRVEPVTVDLADLDSIRRLSEDLVSRFNGLDLLVNNAGIMAVPRRLTTAQNFELQLGTNHLGHFALTGLLLPALLASANSRIVTVSSRMHARLRSLDFTDLQFEQNYQPISAYCRSKLANALFTVELDRRLRRARSSAFSVGAHPGFCRTNLQSAGPRLTGARAGLRVLAGLTQPLAQPAGRGALPVVHAGTHPAVRSGQYFGPGSRGRPASARESRYSPLAYDPEVGARLWAVSVHLTGVEYALDG